MGDSIRSPATASGSQSLAVAAHHRSLRQTQLQNLHFAATGADMVLCWPCLLQWLIDAAPGDTARAA